MDEEGGHVKEFPQVRESHSPWRTMVATLGRRHYRIAIAAALTCLSLFLFWRPEWTEHVQSKFAQTAGQHVDSVDYPFPDQPDINSPPSNVKPDLGNDLDLPTTTATTTTATIPYVTPWSYTPILNPNVHRLPNADHFRGHFFNVTYKGKMTMAEAKAGCDWEDTSDINFQFGESSGWGVDLSWVKQDITQDVIDNKTMAIYNFMNNGVMDFEKVVDKFEGRGIVIVGGKGRSLKRIRVILNQLKRLGCKLPVELHYWGAEILAIKQEGLLDLWPGLILNNLASPDNIYGTVHGGVIHYALKTAAVLNSRFAELLLLDSDNIPVQDPTTLFESDTYKEYGTIFWPDVARTRRNNPMWPITGTPCRKDEWEQESGQLLVNKLKFWHHLELAHWYNADFQYGDFFRSVMLGDKDTFRFAWHAMKTKFGWSPKWVTSVGIMHDDFYCGHTFAQYHPNGEIAFLHGGLLKTMRKEVQLWELEANGGIFQYYKQSEEADADNAFNPKVDFKFDDQKYLPDKYKPPGGLEISSCLDFRDVKARPFSEKVPGFQKTFEEIGGYWIKNDSGSGSVFDNTL